MLDSAGEIKNARPLRILITADAVGGVWRYTVDLVTGLVESGCEVLVAVMGPSPSKEQRAQLERLPFTAVEERNFALEWMDNPWPDVDAGGEWLLELDRGFGADLVHSNGFTHASLNWQKPVVVVAHSCVFSWWKNVLQCSPGGEWGEYKRRVARGFAASDAVVAPSKFMAAEVCREYGIGPSKVRTIYNFSAQHLLVADSKLPFILAAGRAWDRAKNFGLLRDIAPQVHWPIYLAGSGYEASSPGETEKSLHLLGQLPSVELQSEMARASIFVHPAHYEPFGLSVLEAARSGCCLVLSDIGSLRELWADAAVLVDPRNPEAWVRELNRLSGNSSLRHALGERAAAHAQRYQKESSLNAYRALYETLVTKRGSETEEAA